MTDDARPSEAAGTARSVPGGGVRVVIAVVRPFEPDPAVVRTAADLAVTRRAELLMVGTVASIITDWINVIPVDTRSVEQARAVLFAHCVELLFDTEVSWSVEVSDVLSRTRIRQIAAEHTVLGVVLPESRSRMWSRRLTRRLTRDRAQGTRCAQTVIAGV